MKYIWKKSDIVPGTLLELSGQEIWQVGYRPHENIEKVFTLNSQRDGFVIEVGLCGWGIEAIVRFLNEGNNNLLQKTPVDVWEALPSELKAYLEQFRKKESKNEN